MENQHEPQLTNKFNVLDFSTLFCFCFSLTCHALKTWFELLRVKLYRNDLKETKITLS